MKGPVSSSASLGPPLTLVLVLMTSVSPLLGDPGDCSHTMVGSPSRYFDDYDEVVYNASCGHLCPLPIPVGMRNVTQLMVYFPVNHTRVNCSWVIPDLGDAMKSTVMFFEPAEPSSLAHGLVCGGESNASSLSLWDEYTAGGGDAQTTYTICRDPAKSGLEAYSRRSSRVGGPSTLITLTDYQVLLRANPVLLKYIPMDWSDDCHTQDYKEVSVGPLEKTTALGHQWPTSNLRFPNGMRCKWELSSSTTDLIRLRITVLSRTSIPGPCRRDDTVAVQDSGGRSETFTLCDDSDPFFFLLSSASAAPIKVDFTSGMVGGAPEWELSHSVLPPCPRERLTVETDLVENVVYGVLEEAGQSQCRWTLHTNWTNNVVMVTRLELSPPLQDCSPGQDSLTLDLGSSVLGVISLCEVSAAPLPLWSQGLDLHVDLNLAAVGATSRTVSVFYKSVPLVANCQGHPGNLEAVFSAPRTVMAELSWQRTYRHVSAPDCRWLVHPASQAEGADQQVAEVTVSGWGKVWKANVTTAGWFISGFRAYAGDVVNASLGLKENCFYDSHNLLCQFVSTESTLLLVYDPALSTSPTPLDRVSLSVSQVKKVSSGQTGSALRCWYAQWLWLCLVAVWRGVWW